jgi:hypothetical protein
MSDGYTNFELQYLRSTISDFKEIEPYVHLIYAGPNPDVYTKFCFLRRPVEDIVLEIKNAFAMGKKKIIFNNKNETMYFGFLKKSQMIADMFPGVPDDTFYYLTSGIIDQYNYEKIFINKSITPKVKLNIISGVFFESGGKAITHLEIKNYEVKNKEKIFLCFNRIARQHRMNLIAKIISNDLLDKSYTSFFGNINFEEVDRFGWDHWIVDLVNRKEQFRFVTQENIGIIDKNRKLFPIMLNMTPGRNNPCDVQYDDLKYFENSYFSLVTETTFYDELSYITKEFFSEKIFKPIAVGHPFILMAFPRALLRLREMGYKTFHPFINEDYDLIIDDARRFDAIINEVLRLSKFTDEEWITWQENIKDIIDFNKNLLKNKPFTIFTKDRPLFGKI